MVLVFRGLQRSSAVTRMVREGAIVKAKGLVGLGYVLTEPRQQLESAEALDGRAGDQVGALQALAKSVASLGRSWSESACLPVGTADCLACSDGRGSIRSWACRTGARTR